MQLKQFWKKLKMRLAPPPIEIAMNELLDFMVHGPLRCSTKDELLEWVDEVDAKLAVLRAVIMDAWDAEIAWQMKHVLKQIIVKRSLLHQVATLPLLFDLTEDLNTYFYLKEKAERGP
jgi:hypothetical protein